jgi:hAT family C-terminal dimerisation region
MVYDLLAIPAMSSEVERAFSGARNTMDDYHTRLGAAIFEMTEQASATTWALVVTWQAT